MSFEVLYLKCRRLATCVEPQYLEEDRDNDKNFVYDIYDGEDEKDTDEDDGDDNNNDYTEKVDVDDMNKTGFLFMSLSVYRTPYLTI